MKVDFGTDLPGGQPTVTTAELMELIRVIKQRLPYGRVFKHYRLNWKGDGDHQLSCPFHGADRNPSCHYYSASRGIWCFTCAANGNSAEAGGDVVWFVKKMENLSTMYAAVQKIEQLFGVTGRTDLLTRVSEAAAKTTEEEAALCKLHSRSAADKVNDRLYQVRARCGESVNLDKLEKDLFERKRNLDQSNMPYASFVLSIQNWHDNCLLIITRYEEATKTVLKS